jgi:hypothetical protein
MESIKLEVAESRILVLTGEKSFEEMKELAWNKKTAAFGGLKNMLSRPKPEDISIIHSEKQYKPVWHVVCSVHLEYKRKQEYLIKIDDPAVQKVNLCGEEKELSPERTVSVTSIEQCSEDDSREMFIDAHTEEIVEFSKYLEMPNRLISQTEELMADNNIVIPAKVKAAYLIRKMMNDLLKPVDADEVLAEYVRIETMDLYFKPIYAFEYYWEPKGKKNVLEFDGLTGEYQSGKVLKEKVAEVFTEETLFEVGAEVAGFIVPGANIPVKILQEARKKSK